MKLEVNTHKRIMKLKGFNFKENNDSFILHFKGFVATISIIDIKTISDDDFENVIKDIIERSKL